MGLGGRASDISIRGQRIRSPQGAPPKLTEALLVKVSGICRPLLIHPPSASGFLSLDSGVVSMSSRTNESGPAHPADPLDAVL